MKLPEEGKFTVGDRVRVKRGVMDLGYSDMPLGGWAGTVIEVRDEGETCVVRWSRETLSAIHPVFKSRCEIDGCDYEEYTFDEDDLEPDPGGPLDIVHPTEITTEPLSPRDENDRVRMVFGLTSNDPLPGVEMKTLEVYREYLVERLGFPFRAEAEIKCRELQGKRIDILGFTDPAKDLSIDENYGILCDASFKGEPYVVPLSTLDRPAKNRRLIDDYRYWFWNWR